MKISVKLQSFCYDCVYEFGNAFNYSLSAGFEYEDGFLSSFLADGWRALRGVRIERTCCPIGGLSAMRRQ